MFDQRVYGLSGSPLCPHLSPVYPLGGGRIFFPCHPGGSGEGGGTNPVPLFDSHPAPRGRHVLRVSHVGPGDPDRGLLHLLPPHPAPTHRLLAPPGLLRWGMAQIWVHLIAPLFKDLLKCMHIKHVLDPETFSALHLGSKILLPSPRGNI